jgi:hypothetical protein
VGGGVFARRFVFIVKNIVKHCYTSQYNDGCVVVGRRSGALADRRGSCPSSRVRQPKTDPRGIPLKHDKKGVGRKGLIDNPRPQY